MNKQNVNVQLPDVRKVLGNPKITFVLGGPASGKGTQCQKLVEEFGYTHISTGDLFRAEVAKGSREGTMMKEIMDKGGLIPYQLTVQVLINALIANPSKNYLIDGFPRARDQAVYFEQVVGPAQQVLFFNTPMDVCVARCMHRAKSSGRSDDTEETIKARLRTYQEQSEPVVEMYKEFGLVREVDGSGDPIQVFNATRKAMLPQVSWIIGPKISGKTTLGNKLARRTNARLLNFRAFVKDHGLDKSDDETIVQALIQQLALEIDPRIIIEDFPQTTHQAKYFIKNSVSPSKVFSLNCSRDACQERMSKKMQMSPNYMPSALLSKSIAEYNANLKDMLAYLRAETCLTEVNTEQDVERSFKQVCSVVEPLIINVRTSCTQDSQSAAHKIRQVLMGQGFVQLHLNSLADGEQERGTDIGKAFQVSKITDKQYNVAVTNMLRKVIYSGIDGQDKFLLTSDGLGNGPVYPRNINQAKAFEDECANISCVIYCTASSSDNRVEIVRDKVSEKTIETLLQKDFRLKTMTCWDQATFDEHLGKRTQWGVVTGHKYQGSETVRDELMKLMDSKLVNMKAMEEEIKKSMGTEEEPYEGDVPLEKVEAGVIEMVAADKNAGKKICYLFDSWIHKASADFFNFANKEFGLPSFVAHVTCDKKVTEERYKAMNGTEEIAEDAQGELDDANKAADKNNAEVQAQYAAHKSKVRLITMNTDCSNEVLVENLRGNFAPKVILVNHEKALNVDTTCANLALKYNMLYLSAYQMIKDAICNDTPIGALLEKNKKPKEMTADYTAKTDEFKENQYSPVHFEIEDVIELLRQTIASKRTNQQFILLEGMCNNRKINTEDQRLSMRYMDELFQLEKHIGEVSAVISLQNQQEASQWIDEKWEEFEEPPKEEPKKPKLDEEGNPIEEEEEPAEEGAEGEEQKKKWNPAEYKWTISNRRAKNLPQLFKDFKGINVHHENKESKDFAAEKDQAVTKALDDFCQRVLEDHASRYLYQQVIFGQEE